MIQKPKIQYIGEFYIYGSEARKLEPKKKAPKKEVKNPLPESRPNKAVVRYYEPVAIVSLVLSLVLTVTMVLGVQLIKRDWAEYEKLYDRYASLNQKNFQLQKEYKASYDLDDIRRKAEGLHMVPVDQVKHQTILVELPEPVVVVEPTWTEELVQTWKTLWDIK